MTICKLLCGDLERDPSHTGTFAPTVRCNNNLCIALQFVNWSTFEKSCETKVCSYSIPNIFGIKFDNFDIIPKQHGKRYQGRLVLIRYSYLGQIGNHKQWS